jgi:hypothetical protein
MQELGFAAALGLCVGCGVLGTLAILFGLARLVL